MTIWQQWGTRVLPPINRRLAFAVLVVVGLPCAFFALGAFVLDGEPPSGRIVALYNTWDALITVVDDGTPNLRIFERREDRDRLIGVLRGHAYEAVEIRWRGGAEDLPVMITKDKRGELRVTRLDRLDRLPVIEREHLAWVRRNLWQPVGPPVLGWMARQRDSVVAALAPLTTITHDSFSAFRDCAVCPEMIALPGGEFTMGSAGR